MVTRRARTCAAVFAARCTFAGAAAVGGRTIAVIADHKGTGTGTMETDEGPRTYDFLVDSANVDWSFRVEETSGIRR